MRAIGRAARQARRARRLTQEDVADRVGVSTQFYGRIERGYALPSVTTLRRMLDVLDLRADDLLGVPGIEATSDDDAPVQAQMETENPHLRRLMRYLRRASPVTLHVVNVLLDEIEKAEAILHGDRASARAGRDGAPPDEDEDGEARNDGDGPAGDSSGHRSDQGDAPEDPDQPDED